MPATNLLEFPVQPPHSGNTKSQQLDPQAPAGQCAYYEYLSPFDAIEAAAITISKKRAPASLRLWAHFTYAGAYRQLHRFDDAAALYSHIPIQHNNVSAAVLAQCELGLAQSVAALSQQELARQLFRRLFEAHYDFDDENGKIRASAGIGLLFNYILAKDIGSARAVITRLNSIKELTQSYCVFLDATAPLIDLHDGDVDRACQLITKILDKYTETDQLISEMDRGFRLSLAKATFNFAEALSDTPDHTPSPDLFYQKCIELIRPWGTNTQLTFEERSLVSGSLFGIAYDQAARGQYVESTKCCRILISKNRRAKEAPIENCVFLARCLLASLYFVENKPRNLERLVSSLLRQYELTPNLRSNDENRIAITRVVSQAAQKLFTSGSLPRARIFLDKSELISPVLFGCAKNLTDEGLNNLEQYGTFASPNNIISNINLIRIIKNAYNASMSAGDINDRVHWADRQGDDKKLSIPQFISKYYSDYIERNILTQAIIRQHDQSLYVALYNWRKHNNDSDLPFTPTKRAGRSLEAFTALYGEKGESILNNLREIDKHRAQIRRDFKRARLSIG